MTDSNSQIPFIDIAVQDVVREAMLDGKAIVVFDEQLENIVWANGLAAHLFGYDSIADITGSGLTHFATTLRQLKSAVAQGKGQPQSVLLRVASGLQSRLAAANIRLISIPYLIDRVALLVIERSDELADTAQLAQDTIFGLEADGAIAAITGENGVIVAKSPLFDEFHIPSAELAALTKEVEHETDRLVKRLVHRNSGQTTIAVGFGRLSESPVRNLIVAVDTGELPEQRTPDSPAPNSGADDIAKGVRAGFGRFQTPAPPLVELGTHEAEDDAFEAELMDDNIGESDKSYIPDLDQGPVRFVWKTDRDGAFIEVSEAFSTAVGENAADIVGRTMTDVIQVFELDPSGDIEASMQRRDTWSGKIVLWPIQGTDLRVPVDLAALPYYNREREFEGYRGFGIVRMADAVVDPEAIGLSLISGEPEQGPNDLDLADDETNQDGVENEPPLFEDSSRSTVVPFTRFADSTPKSNGELDDKETEAFKQIGKTLTADVEPESGGENSPASSPESAGDAAGDEFERDDDTLPENQDTLDDDWLKRLDEANAMKNQLSSVDAVAGADSHSANEDETDKALPSGSEEPTDKNASTFAGSDGLGPAELTDLPLPILIVRGETALYANQAFTKISGYSSAKQLTDVGLHALFDDSDRDLEQNTSSDDRHLKLVRVDGTTFNARAHLQLVPWRGSKAMMFAFEPQLPLSDDDMSPDFAATELDDEQVSDVALPNNSVTEVSESLKSAAFDEVAELRAILDTATDGVVVIGPEGNIRSINGSASALFGYQNEDVSGKSFSILFAHESQRAAMDYLNGFNDNSVASLLNEGREVLARERNGGFLPVFMTIGKLPTSNGYCAVMRDITPWKQTEHALEAAKGEAEEASNAKSEFLAKISHEIRTPLNAIIGFSELMSEERFGPIGNDRYKDYLVDINKSGRHVLDLVNDLLDISKIEAGEQDLEFEGVLLNEQVADAIAMMQPQANRNRIIVRSSLESNLPMVVADARSIKQIALNLLSNSIRFTPSGGQVIVTTNYTARGSVVLRIRDTGVGMSDNEVETALRPFKQVEASQNGDGTGLGLPLTKALVQANRADFDIASEPGRGTCIEVTFPSARVLAD